MQQWNLNFLLSSCKQQLIGWINFQILWAMVIWNSSLQHKYDNLLVLVKIAWVQCVSIATCEKVFIIQNWIKSKLQKNLKIRNLEIEFHIGLKGPTKGYEPILMKITS